MSGMPPESPGQHPGNQRATRIRMARRYSSPVVPLSWWHVRFRREQVRLEAAEMFAQDADARQIARSLRVSTKSSRRRSPACAVRPARCVARRTCCTGWALLPRSRRIGPQSGMRMRSRPGAARHGRRYEASGGDRGVDVLRGRVRAGAAATEGAHLGPQRAHPRSPGLRLRFRPDPGHQLRPGTRRAMSEAGYAALITAAHRYLDAPSS
jgi:hypothetical protein